MNIYVGYPFEVITSDDFDFGKTYKPLTKRKARKFARYLKREFQKLREE